MARKLGKKNKERVITVRATEEQLDELENSAISQGLTRSDYIRDRIYTPQDKISKPKADELTRTLKAIYRELRATGNNINQIAREVNTAIASEKDLPKYVSNPESLDDLGIHLDSLSETVKGIVAELSPKPARKRRTENKTKNRTK